MKRVYRFIGLDCADCTAKLERRLAQIDGMKSISINFLTQKGNMEIEDEKAEEVIERLMTIVKETELDVEVKRA